MKNLNTENPELWVKLEAYHQGTLSKSESTELSKLLKQDNQLQEWSLSVLLEQIKQDNRPKEQWFDILKSQSFAEPERIKEFLRFEDGLSFVSQNRKLFIAAAAAGRLSNPEDFQKIRNELEQENVPMDGFFSRINNIQRALQGIGSRLLWKTALSMVFLILFAGLGIFLAIDRGWFQGNNANQQINLEDIPDYELPAAISNEVAKQYFDEFKYAKALQELEKIKSHFDSIPGRDEITLTRLDFFIALCKIRLGEYKNAREILERTAKSKEEVLRGHPEDLFLGLLYYKENQLDKAKKHLLEAKASTEYLKNEVPISDIAAQYLSKIDDI